MTVGLPEDLLALLGPRPEELEQHIRDLATKLGVFVWTSWHKPGRCDAGMCIHGREDEQVDVQLVYPPNTLDSYTTALHELGHAAQRHARHPDEMVREQRAWLWARGHVLPGVKLDEENIAQCLERHPQHPEAATT